MGGERVWAKHRAQNNIGAAAGDETNLSVDLTNDDSHEKDCFTTLSTVAGSWQSFDPTWLLACRPWVEMEEPIPNLLCLLYQRISSPTLTSRHTSRVASMYPSRLRGYHPTR